MKNKFRLDASSSYLFLKYAHLLTYLLELRNTFLKNHQMASLTPQIIRNKLSEYDSFVRKALEDGDLDRMVLKETEIVSYYFILLNFTHNISYFYRKHSINLACA